ncbi:MAG: hypothetical protein K8U57_31930 [Planctomycetes bacterium]|nr:hypothetical protein [Planctomycetota bacterium]
MIRLSRTLLGAALVVGVFASTAPTARAAEPDKLLPADTDLVAVVNLKQILDSEIIKKYALEQIKQVLEGQDVKKLLGDLGLDPLKDVEKLVAASIETKFANNPEAKYLLIVHGKFDADKLYKTAEAESKKNGDKFQMVKDGNTIMFKVQPDNGQPPLYATVVNDTTVIAASEKKLITTALAADTASKPAAIKKELAELIKKADDKSSVLLISLLKGKLDDVKIPGGGNLPVKLDKFEKMLPAMEAVTLSVKIGADVNLDITIGMKDEDAAGDMRNALDDLLKQVKPLAQFAGAADPRLKPLSGILDSVKTSSKNKDVSVSGKVTGTDIGKMINPKD